MPGLPAAVGAPPRNDGASISAARMGACGSIARGTRTTLHSTQTSLLASAADATRSFAEEARAYLVGEPDDEDCAECESKVQSRPQKCIIGICHGVLPGMRHRSLAG